MAGYTRRKYLSILGEPVCAVSGGGTVLYRSRRYEESIQPVLEPQYPTSGWTRMARIGDLYRIEPNSRLDEPGPEPVHLFPRRALHAQRCDLQSVLGDQQHRSAAPVRFGKTRRRQCEVWVCCGA